MPIYLQIFEDQRELIEGLPDEAIGELLRGMMAYNFDGTVMPFKTYATYVWPAIRQQLDKNLASMRGKIKAGQASADSRYPQDDNSYPQVEQSTNRVPTECQQSTNRVPTDSQQTVNK